MHMSCTLCIFGCFFLACMHIHRGAEAGGILGVNTPHFFGLTTPTFWRDIKTEVREGA